MDKTQTAAGIVVRAENERTARAVGSLNNECTNLPRSSRCLPSRSNPRETADGLHAPKPTPTQPSLKYNLMTAVGMQTLEKAYIFISVIMAVIWL